MFYLILISITNIYIIRDVTQNYTCNLDNSRTRELNLTATPIVHLHESPVVTHAYCGSILTILEQ